MDVMVIQSDCHSFLWALLPDGFIKKKLTKQQVCSIWCVTLAEPITRMKKPEILFWAKPFSSTSHPWLASLFIYLFNSSFVHLPKNEGFQTWKEECLERDSTRRLVGGLESRAICSGMDTLGFWMFQGEEDVGGATGQGQEEVRRGMCLGLTVSRIWNHLVHCASLPKGRHVPALMRHMSLE